MRSEGEAQPDVVKDVIEDQAVRSGRPLGRSWGAITLVLGLLAGALAVPPRTASVAVSRCVS
jgi:hypothetical protein